MSLYATVRCNNCGGRFNLYHRDMQNEKPNSCPFCNTKMTEKQWAGLVNAYNCLEDWNAQCKKSNVEHGAPAFAAEIRRHHVPGYKFNIH